MSQNINNTILPLKEHLELLFEDSWGETCDEFDSELRQIEDLKLPPWYDDVKYKRGQKYVQNNILGVFLSHLLGVLAITSLPEGLLVLDFTKMSGTTYLAYRRYVGTMKHIYIWYHDGFEPGSKAWESILRVRKMHYSASRRARAEGLKPITQSFLAGTQFGFMGYALIRPNNLGMLTDCQEDIEGFLHMWRVIGWLLGIEDRYNICRPSVEETRHLCESVLYTVISSSIQSTNPMYVHISDTIVNGLWHVFPLLYKGPFMYFLFRVTESNRKLEEIQDLCQIAEPYRIKHNLTNIERKKAKNETINSRLCFILDIVLQRYLHSSLWRFCLNKCFYLLHFIMNYFPIIAIYKFGFKKAYVDIFPK